jgi:membrane associated rhomboid family serine protease
VIPIRNDVPTLRPPVVTWALLGACVLAFAWQLSVGVNLSALVGGMIPWEIMTLRDIGPRDLVPPPFTILTSLFLHGGFLHLGGNLLFLWVFGGNVEDALGHGRYLAFYLASGVAAAVAQTLLSVAAGDPLVPMVGASGAIAGVMAAFMVLHPGARVLTVIPIFFLIRVVHLPAKFFIGLWFALQVLYAFLGGAGSGVAFFAHVGGFLFGWVVISAMVHRRRPA